MTDITAGRASDFRVGNVLNRAWEIMAPNFLPFFAVTFVVALPNLIFLLRDPRSGGFGWTFAVAIFSGMVLGVIGQAVILFGAFQQLRGEPVRIGEAFQKGLQRFLPIIGLGFLYALGIFFGALLLIIPGIMLMVRWSVALPACVVEGMGPTDSLGRSAALTKGHRWMIFGIVIVLTIGSAVVNKLLTLLLAPAGVVVAAFGSLIWTALWSVYWNCVIVMVYHDLRVAKEGIDTAQIASVFD